MFVILLYCYFIFEHWIEVHCDSNSTHRFGSERFTFMNYPIGVNIRLGWHEFCSGSLVAPVCAITAAHCIEGFELDGISVCAGHVGFKRGKCTTPYKLFVSQFYNRETLDSNFGLMFLRRELYTAYTIPLELDFNEVPTGASVIAVGWGDTNEQSTVQHKRFLRSENLTVLSREECSKQISPLGENMMCVKNYNRRFVMYHGDSGGLLLYNGKQVGILASCSKFDAHNMPALYVKFSSPTVRRQLEYAINKCNQEWVDYM